MNIDKLKIVILQANPKRIQIINRPIRLADVLIVLKKEDEVSQKTWTANTMRFREAIEELIAGAWDLEEDLDNQSDETQQFLSNLLVK